MERFQDVLDHAKCSDNSVKFTFKKEVAFDLVQKDWQWVNDAHNKYIVLVTENAKCNAPDGDHTSRQPWHIKAAAFDNSKNTVTLTAQPKTWENAFSHWHLKVDSKGLLPHIPHPRHRLAKRLGIDNKTISLNLAATLPSDPIDLTSDDDGEIAASIACNPCYTTGSLDFLVDVTYRFPFQLTGTVTMTPNDIAAHITAELSLQGDLTSQAQVGKEIFSYVPEGINIPGIATIGPAFKVDLVAGIESANAQVDLSSGVVMSIPADAKAVLDFSDSNNNQFFGWTPEFQPNIPDNQLAGEVSITAYAGVQLRAEFDMEIVSHGLSAGLALDAPTLDLTVSAMGNTGGDVCGVAGADFGVGLSLGLGAELDGFAGFGAATDEPNKIAIFSTSADLFSTCMTVASGPPKTSLAVVPIATSSAAAGNASAAVSTSSAATPTSSSIQGSMSSNVAWYSSRDTPASSSVEPATSARASGASSALPYHSSAVAISSAPKWRNSSSTVGSSASTVVWSSFSYTY
jgi:hypothetical protein